MVQHNPELTAAAMSALDNFKGLGLEIAPYFDPFVDRAKYKVLYTDYISTDEIKEKALENPTLSGQAIPEVDFVWTPGSHLRERAPPIAFDYVVASHVMEHVPNPVGWLNELLSVTKTGGKVVLFLPDRRQTSDLYRNITSFAEMVELWISQPDVPTPRQVADFMGGSFRNDHGTSNFFDGAKTPTSADRSYSDEDAIDTAKFVSLNNNYIDVHATVWEPVHFADVLRRLSAAGLINVDVGDPVSEGAEFMVVITKLGEPLRLPPDKFQMKLKDMEHRIRIMHDDVVHTQKSIFHDLAFLIQKHDEDQNTIRNLLLHNKPLWRVIYEFLTR